MALHRRLAVAFLDFHLPFGIFQPQSGQPRAGVAIGDLIWIFRARGGRLFRRRGAFFF